MSYISEFLLMSQNGQNYIKDIKFSAFPFGDYNITVIFYSIVLIFILEMWYVLLGVPEYQEVIAYCHFSLQMCCHVSPYVPLERTDMGKNGRESSDTYNLARLKTV